MSIIENIEILFMFVNDLNLTDSQQYYLKCMILDFLNGSNLEQLHLDKLYISLLTQIISFMYERKEQI